ncbi:MAG: hypothetical protein COV47_05620 [Candidatus Diapherotrites archaeon CG11_big_fil_rev_8_21_14_0_20_37_9]|nr:MAG: hypothetical protein COV47_05620 [Candidatus Diapherotrites archaeon CG11_big_fil_rev_8_21_14_0_20_37_9]
MKKIYTVIIEKDENGWLIADVPEIQGCHTQAKTMDKLMERTKEAIQLCLDEDLEVGIKTRFVGIQRIEV